MFYWKSSIITFTNETIQEIIQVTRKLIVLVYTVKQTKFQVKMANMDTTLQNLREKTFVYSKIAFAMAVDEKIPRTQNTLLDENLMIMIGIKPT